MSLKIDEKTSLRELLADENIPDLDLFAATQITLTRMFGVHAHKSSMELAERLTEYVQEDGMTLSDQGRDYLFLQIAENEVLRNLYRSFTDARYAAQELARTQ